MQKITQFLKKNLFIVVVVLVLIALSTVFIIWNKNYLFVLTKIVPTKTVTPTQVPLASPPIQTQSQAPFTPVPEIQKTEGFLEKARETLSLILRGGSEKSAEPTSTPGVSSQGSPQEGPATPAPSGSEQGAGSVPMGTKPSQGSSDTSSEATEPKSAFSPKPVRIP